MRWSGYMAEILCFCEKNNNGYHGSRRYSAGTESTTGFTPAAQNQGASNGGCAPPQPIKTTKYQRFSLLIFEAAFLRSELLPRSLLLLKCP